jgi:hypothetical protein
MKMGRRLRYSSVTYPFKIRALLAPFRRPILIATKHMPISGTGHLDWHSSLPLLQSGALANRIPRVPLCSTLG